MYYLIIVEITKQKQHIINFILHEIYLFCQMGLVFINILFIISWEVHAQF